jgi:hypothetical protein
MTRVDRITAEKAIMQRFAYAYEKRYRIKLANILHGDVPDFEAMDSSTENVFALEVTGVYQDDREAMIQYGEIEDWGRFKGSSEELLERLNRVLQSKAKKSFTYDVSDPLHLAVHIGSLVFNHAIDIDFIRPGIDVPDNAYQFMWLIVKSRDDYSPELYELQVPVEDQNQKAG